MPRMMRFACGEGALVCGGDSRLLVLDSRAAHIWHALDAGLDDEAIARAIADGSDGDIELIRRDVGALVAQRQGAGVLADDGDDGSAEFFLLPQSPPAWAGTWRCRLRNVVVDIAVERPQDARLLDRWITDYVVAADAADVRIEVYDAGAGNTMTFVDNRLFGHGEGTRRASRALVGLAWPEVSLCATMHAGVVAGDRGGVCIAGVSGSGKSSLIAKLVSGGLRYLSDDLTPLSMDGRLVPWPMPVSVKEGSWPLLAAHFSALDDAPSFMTKRRCAKMLKLDATAWRADPETARALIFPCYRPGDTPSPDPLSPIEALQQLILAGIVIEAPISDDRVEALIAWLERTPAYRLPFGDLDVAAAHVHRLLELG